MIELITPVLTIVIGWLVQRILRALKVSIDEATYNALIAGIVAYLLALLGVHAGARAGLW